MGWGFFFSGKRVSKVIRSFQPRTSGGALAMQPCRGQARWDTSGSLLHGGMLMASVVEPLIRPQLAAAPMRTAGWGQGWSAASAAAAPVQDGGGKRNPVS